jgi:hypothetical protein
MRNPFCRGLNAVLMFAACAFAQAPAWRVVSGPPVPKRINHAMAYDDQRGRAVLVGGQVADGSGTCLGDTWELDGIAWVPRGAGPPARFGHGLAYDAQRARTMLFGGWNGSSLQNDLWEWNGSSWLHRLPAHQPAPRTGAAMAYDSLRGRIVLFGGLDGTSTRNDTWEWDGVDWSLSLPAAAPARRFGHAMAYDLPRGRIVLFGGSNQLVNLADTWEWDGVIWTQRTGGAAPPARSGHMMAFDPVRARTVLFGGSLSAVFNPSAAAFADTWEWDGNVWAARSPSSSPNPRAWSAMTFDSRRGQVILSDYEIWSWDGSNWIAPQPPARYLTGMAYDDRRNRTVLFSGEDGSRYPFFASFDDTWEWDGATWSRRAPLHAPQARKYHAMAYDDRRGKIVLFGGAVLSNTTFLTTLFADTWTWDGLDWRQEQPLNSPSARNGHAMAYDSQRDRMVMFGNFLFISDTWEWDGANWSQASPANAPPSRSLPGMAFDSLRARVVLFGGQAIFTMLDDTWEWDGVNWTPLAPASRPAARGGHGMVFDSRRGRTRVFGGNGVGPTGYGNDLWEWDGAAWTQIATGGALRGRQNFGMAYDASRDRLVMFGGHEGSVTTSMGDAWEYGTAGFAVAQSYGPGCGTLAMTATAAAGSRPVLGQTVSTDIVNVPATLAFMALGWSSAQAGSLDLPIDLMPFGMPGCLLLQSVDYLGQPCTITGPGTARHSLSIPNTPGLVGTRLFLQAWAPASGANPAGLVVSNGVALFLGNL